MFSLIIVLLSILVLGALVAATLFFGGSAFSEGGTAAAVARMTNEAAQIAGAAAVHRVQESRYAENIEQLVAASYLTVTPRVPWQPAQDTAVLPNVPQAHCAALNTQYGISGIPSCLDPAFVGRPVCCTD